MAARTPMRWTDALVRKAMALVIAFGEECRERWTALRKDPERGSESVEKAIIAAIALTMALGLMAAIVAVVHKYQSRIK